MTFVLNSLQLQTGWSSYSSRNWSGCRSLQSYLCDCCEFVHSNQSTSYLSGWCNLDYITSIWLGDLYLKMDFHSIYLFSDLFLFFTVFLKIKDFIGMIIITAIMSFVRTWLHLPQPLVFADHLQPERFASGFGQFMFFQGNLYFILGPVAGWIRDVTQSYVVCFHSLSFIMALCAVPWIVEILWLQMCKKSKSDGKNENINNNSSW